MKNKEKRAMLFIFIMLFTAFLNVSLAQPAPPPSSNGGHDLGGNQGKGSNAPLTHV